MFRIDAQGNLFTNFSSSLIFPPEKHASETFGHAVRAMLSE